MNRVYVFTSTGNGLKLGREMAEQLGDTEVISITKLMKQKEWSITGDSVGIIFPCYYGTTPDIVLDFVKQATTIESNYFYGLVTSGGNAGYSLTHLKRALQERGAELHYGDKHVIASNYMNGWYYDMMMPDKKTLEKRLSDVLPFCKKAADSIRSQKTNTLRDSYMEYLIPRIISPNRYVKDTRPWDKEFEISNSCKGCGTCKKVCPVDNITIKGKRPHFSGNCQRCMACIQFCPKKAYSIEGKSMNKQHYSHPEVSITDLQKFHAL